MTEYQKIPTLYKFDSNTKRFTNEIAEETVDYLKNCAWLASEKIDGTNIRVYYDGHRVSWSGRTDKSSLPKEIEQLLQDTFGDSEIIFEQVFGEKEVLLFMECYGGKVQGGLYGGKERLIGFDVMVNNVYLDKRVIAPIFERFGVPTVRFVEVVNLEHIIARVKYMAKIPTEYYISECCENQTTPIEGFVCVPACRLFDNRGKRIIVKIKVCDMKKLAEG